MHTLNFARLLLAALLLSAFTTQAADTRYLSANELRHYFGVVPQETVLFSGTIYENKPHAARFSVG
jgi:ABC-type multidrug transport system fused ATPase/permease subunit